jgi:hypothetical protein
VSSFSAPSRWGSIADRAVPSAATPAATAASLATRFSFDVLGRLDFFDFVGRLVFVCLRVFDLAATRFELFFDLTRRFDELLDLARFFAFFMIPPFDWIYLDWASILLPVKRSGWISDQRPEASLLDPSPLRPFPLNMDGLLLEPTARKRFWWN